jgi:hypothetical protein
MVRKRNNLEIVSWDGRAEEGATPGVLPKSVETIDRERVIAILFFEECGSA